ncbi:MAG: pilus assembly PilX family protein [Steroidobacteraceae bacterium]
MKHPIPAIAAARRTAQLPARHKGMALITGLLLLLVVTIIAVSMFRGFGVEEQIAGNTREKQRSLNSAVSAEQYAEWWLTSGQASAATACAAGFVSSDTGEICNATTPQPDFTSMPWSTGVTYVPFSSSQTISGASAASQGSYYQPPGFYITDWGTAQGGTLYQIDAYGWGGTSNSVSVIEATFVITSGGATHPLDWKLQ